MKKFTELYERTMDVTQRKQMAKRMAKMAKSSIVQTKKKKAALKMRDPAKLAQVARKKVMQTYRDKFYPDYEMASMQQKVKIDQKIQQKYGNKIAKIATKMASKLKKSELERVKKARAAVQGKQDA